MDHKYIYLVYDNNKLAQFPDQKIHPSWKNARFNTLNEARAYANRYFHPYPAPQDIGEKINYSGYGDIGEIIRVKQ